jgi:uncharacterized protein YcbX
MWRRIADVRVTIPVSLAALRRTLAIRRDGAARRRPLNTRLAARCAPAVTMQRFRPNLVLVGLQPYEDPLTS